MQLIDATEEHFEACLPLLGQLWPALGSGAAVEADVVAQTKAAFCRLLNRPDARVLLAEEDGRVLALMDLTFRETLFYRGPAMIIEDLVVDEDHRRRGIGQRLVELAERIARHRGCRGAELSCDLHRAETHRFWEAVGYQREAYQFRKTL